MESLYKIIAKVIVDRLSSVTGVLISPNHSCFLKGRIFVDGMTVVNKLLDLSKTCKKTCPIFKVDVRKAYDYIS